MAKPIGNLIANLKTNDTVSRRLTAKFQPKTSLAALAHEQKPANPPAKTKKYKTRKK